MTVDESCGFAEIVICEVLPDGSVLSNSTNFGADVPSFNVMTAPADYINQALQDKGYDIHVVITELPASVEHNVTMASRFFLFVNNNTQKSYHFLMRQSSNEPKVGYLFEEVILNQEVIKVAENNKSFLHGLNEFVNMESYINKTFSYSSMLYGCLSPAPEVIDCIPTSLSFVPNSIFANKNVALRAYFNDVLVSHTLYETGEEKTFISREEKHESWLSHRLLLDLIVFYIGQARYQFEVLPDAETNYSTGDLNLISYENEQAIATPMPPNQEITIKGYGYEEAINRFGDGMYIERRPAVLKLVKIPQNELPSDTVCFVTEQFGQNVEIDACAFVQSIMN